MSGFFQLYPNYPTFAWASVPAAASLTGRIIQVSDVGVSGGSLFISNGTNWKPLFPVVIARSNSGVGNSSSTNSAEFNLATVTIPAGLMGLNGTLAIDFFGSQTASTNSRTWNLRHNTTSGAVTGGTLIVNNANAAANASFRALLRLSNRASASVQLAAPAALATGGGYGAGAKVDGAIDTGSVSYLNFNGIKATGTETMTLESYQVVLQP
jgi:hypothetical protein